MVHDGTVCGALGNVLSAVDGAAGSTGFEVEEIAKLWGGNRRGALMLPS